MDFEVRTRRKPTVQELMYGQFASKMVAGTRYFVEMRDRAAYTYITGNFPSHLRKEYTAALMHFSSLFKKPSSLDGRLGHSLMHPEIVQDLLLARHPMVVEVRRRIATGYLIQGSRGFGTRNGYHNIFMFKLGMGKNVVDRVTVKLDGAVKQGWGGVS